MKCAVAIVLALVGVVTANPAPWWGSLGSVVIPGGGVTLSSSVVNHGISIPVVKPIISAPIYTGPVIRTPVVRAPVITTLGWGGLGWGSIGSLSLGGYGWGGLSTWSGKGWH